ncbi:hypothetical protein GCM10009624_07120 [Gordonia sinesedis]
MSRGTTGASHGTPMLARFGAAAVISVLGATGAGEALAAPSGSQRPPSQVSQLINQIAGVNQNIQDLDNAVAVRQQAANQAIADYQNSLAAQRLASVAAKGAQDSLSRAVKATGDAQRRFDKLIRSVYRSGSGQGSMSNYVSSDDPQGVLDRVSVVNRLARQQEATIRNLEVARNQQANRAAALEATKRQAAFAADGAAQRRSAALAAVNQARAAMANEKQRRSSLIKQRETVQAQLDRLRGRPAPTPAAAPASKDLLSNLFRGPGPQGPAPALPPGRPAAGGDNEALAVAAEAAARLALDVTQKVLAGVVGQQQLPQSELLNELGIGGATLGSSGNDNLSSRLGSGSLGSLFGSSSGPGGGGGGGEVRPGLRGPQAVEIVVNRALSQLNVPYAWGGGDANGPTKGIRDGGVADSFGDYNKIGFDCSGLMVYAFAGVGIQLPKYSGYQYTAGPQVPLAQIQRGDMIFYGPNASQHVALYLGDNKMVESPQSGSYVKVSPLRTDGAMPNVVRLL